MSQKPIEFVKDYFLIDFIERRFDIQNSSGNTTLRLQHQEYLNKFGMDVKMMHNHQAELIKIGIYVGIEFFDAHRNPLQLKGEFIYESIYKMPDYTSKFPSIGSSNLYTDVELQLLLRLTNLSLGMTRGYLMQKCVYTELEGFVLPLITDDTLLDMIQNRM